MKKEILYRLLPAFVFLVAFTAQNFSNSFIIADYYTNTKAYAKNCLNKYRPKMHCNGKCQLMKKLQEQEKKDQDNPERKSETKNEIPLSSKSFFATISQPEIILVTSSVRRSLSYGHAIDRSFDIFHPPQDLPLQHNS